MTIQWLGHLTATPQPPACECLWFDGRDLTRSWFALSTLELVSE